MKKFLSLSWLPLAPDFGLLALRVAVSFLMIRYHGWGKLTGWADESLRLPNLFSLAGAQKEFHTFPNYIGLGSELSYVLVTWCETFGSLAIMAGLLTRLHSLGLFVTMMVAWVFHHHLRLRARGGRAAVLVGIRVPAAFSRGAGQILARCATRLRPFRRCAGEGLTPGSAGWRRAGGEGADSTGCRRRRGAMSRRS